QGDQEALVLRDEDEIDERDDDEEDVERLVALPRLVPGDTLPSDVVARWECLGGDLLDRLNGLTARVPLPGNGLDRGGRVEVVAGDLVETLLLLDLHERRVGDHLPA